jgi:hypothetical protein
MRHNMLTKALVGITCLAFGSMAMAQDAPAPAATATKAAPAKTAAPNYGELISQAGKKFSPLTAKDVAAAKGRLAASIDQLSAYLDNNGAHGAGWKKYFGWDELTTQLAADAKPSLKTLKKIRDKFVVDHEGLDWPIYATVGDQLSEYIEVVRYSSAADQKVVYDAQLKALTADLDNYAKKPTELGAFAIGARIGYLKATGQATELVDAIRSNMSRSNLYIQTSVGLVDAGMSRDIDQSTDIYDNILGVSISGTGHTTGKVRMNFVESDDAAILETKMVATVISNTVGQKGPATVWSKGTTNVTATIPLKFTGDRLTAESASASATTSTEFQGLCTKPKFLEKAAWRKAYKSKPTAEYIAARHAEWRVQEKMEEEAGKSVADANSKLDEKFRLPLLRLRAYPQTISVSTSTDHLSIIALQADGSQIAAPSDAPQLDDGSDLAVRIHESMLNNLTARTLAGNTYTDDQLKKALKDLTGKVPEELANNEDKDPWSITFTQVRPMIFEFDGQHFALTIQGAKYTSGEKEYKSMNISVKYKMEKTDKGSKLTRVGEIQFAPPGHKPGKTLSAAQIALRTILQKKLKSAFKPVIESDGLKLPGKFEKVGKLRLAQLASNAGWLTLAWKMPEQAEPAAETAADASKSKADKLVSK